MDSKNATAYAIHHDDFKQNKLSLLVPSSLASPTLLLNESPITGKKNLYIVKGDSGKSSEVLLRFSIMDSIPEVTINKIKIGFAPKLKWYEYVLAMTPFSIAVFGGAIGGAIGFLGMRFNFIVFRSDMSLPWKLIGSFIVTTTAVIFYFMIVIPLVLFLR